jgi:ribosome-associated protein
MDIRKLQRAIVDGLEDVKAHDIVVFNTEHLSPLFERVIIASGTSNRQTKALAASVRDSVKSRGMQVMRTEGEDNGEWIIVDCGAAVAHIMQPTIRTYYHLEEIWGEKPVRMKMDNAGRPGPGAVKPMRAANDEAQQAIAKRPETGRVLTGKAASPAKGNAAKTPGAKAPGAKTLSAKTPGAKTPGAKTAGSRTTRSKAGNAKPRAAKTASRKTPLRSPISRTTGTKTPARKAPAKKAAATGRR